MCLLTAEYSSGFYGYVFYSFVAVPVCQEDNDDYLVWVSVKHKNGLPEAGNESLFYELDIEFGRKEVTARRCFTFQHIKQVTLVLFLDTKLLMKLTWSLFEL